MTETLQNFLEEHLYLTSLIIVLCVGAIIVAMGVDLVFGIRKAKANGEATTSTGLKKTCTKSKKYFSPLITLVCIDIISCIVIPFPVFTMVWAAYCVSCEFLSVREKSWQKAEIRKQEKTVRILLENKDDIANLIAEAIRKKEEKA